LLTSILLSESQFNPTDAEYGKKFFIRLSLFQNVCANIVFVCNSGQLAQLVERLPYKQDVTGSSPVPPIFKRFSSKFFVECRCSVIARLRFCTSFSVRQEINFLAQSYCKLKLTEYTFQSVLTDFGYKPCRRRRRLPAGYFSSRRTHGKVQDLSRRREHITCDESLSVSGI
jgi:hypothetical protein